MVSVKEKSSEILADENNREIFWKRSNLETFPRSPKNFSESEGNLKQWEMHHCLRGDGRPCEPVLSAFQAERTNQSATVPHLIAKLDVSVLREIAPEIRDVRRHQTSSVRASRKRCA